MIYTKNINIFYIFLIISNILLFLILNYFNFNLNFNIVNLLFPIINF